ncbi:hypothetical protein CDAR_440681 [Caerostris darwini]|uniref:Uncharacterized protein n=1 Tax=Caerostris darwini TaxID=1538125 RepID=A0AAV4ML57_9ARAC|nr:hypothetical protein CDAR_440681 [Caerostris darwini]
MFHFVAAFYPHINSTSPLASSACKLAYPDKCTQQGACSKVIGKDFEKLPEQEVMVKQPPPAYTKNSFTSKPAIHHTYSETCTPAGVT